MEILQTDKRRSKILAINGGSSSIKFAVFAVAEKSGNEPKLQQALSGKIERIGLEKPTLTIQIDGGASKKQTTKAKDHAEAAQSMIKALGDYLDLKDIKGVGHRVVNGGPNYAEPEMVSKDLIHELKTIAPYDPDHMPSEIALIELLQKNLSGIPQVACFDTAFHRTMPRLAQILPIPRRYEAKGIRRYGFHGISCAFLMSELARVAGQDAANGRVIIAHLGNGASLTAVKDGKSIDTTMAFTPTAGVPMSTRSGDLDPGIAFFLAKTEEMTPTKFNDMVNHESGLLGISETSSDMQDLQNLAKTDIRAAEAVDVFCYQVRKAIGALAASLGGLDTLIFSGGIGENAHSVRARICEGLGFLGVELDRKANREGQPVISKRGGSVGVRVIRTDEEQMIARSVLVPLTLK